jgi:hypothetical protein
LTALQVPVDSCGIRKLVYLTLEEFLGLIDSDIDVLTSVANLAVQCRSPQSAARSLGLELHPSLLNMPKGKNANRNPLYAKVIYHADHWTLYGCSVMEAHTLRPEAFKDSFVVGSAIEEDILTNSGPEVVRIAGQVQVPKLPEVLAVESALVLDHVRSVLKGRQDTFLSMHVRPGQFRALSDVLSQHSGSADAAGRDYFWSKDSLSVCELDDQLPRCGLQDLVQGAGCNEARLQDLLFVRVVSMTPSRLFRAHVHMESQLNATDMVVQAHAIVTLRLEDRAVVVNQAPASVLHGESGSQPLLFSPALFSDSFNDCYLWMLQDSLVYSFRRDVFRDDALPAELSPLLNALLADLTASSCADSMEVLHGDLANRDRLRLLNLLVDAELVQQDADEGAFSTWHLSPLGKAGLLVGYQLHNARPVTSVRPGILQEDMSLWELSQLLTRRGWRFEAVPGHRKGKLIPYLPGRERVWYCGVASLTPRSYFTCLLLEGGGALADTEVPHFKGERYYTDLLAGRNPALRQGRVRGRHPVNVVYADGRLTFPPLHLSPPLRLTSSLPPHLYTSSLPPPLNLSASPPLSLPISSPLYLVTSPHLVERWRGG